MEPLATIERLGLTVESAFVPFSRSRNAEPRHGAEKPWQSINWKVTIKRNGRDVLTTDYSAGIANCPGYTREKAPVEYVAKVYRKSDGTTRYATDRERLEQFKAELTAAECESGFPMRLNQWAREPGNHFERVPKSAPIMPNLADVIHSLVMDSSVLDHGTFESWAADYGYDTDSRSAESTYRDCLAIALQLRAAIGEAGLDDLRNAFQDY